MTLGTVALRYLQGRVVTSALTAVSVALGVSLVIASVLLTRGIKEGFIEGATDYSLIVGAKGSPTQLVLNVVFRMDAPTPNIPLRDLRGSGRRPARRGRGAGGHGRRVPGIPLRGDEPSLLRAPAMAPEELHGGRRDGCSASDAPERPGYEAVLGAEAARRTGLQLGDRFYEGEEMAEYPAHGGRRPAFHAERRRPRDLPLPAELLGDERDRPQACRSSRSPPCSCGPSACRTCRRCTGS